MPLANLIYSKVLLFQESFIANYIHMYIYKIKHNICVYIYICKTSFFKTLTLDKYQENIKYISDRVKFQYGKIPFQIP